MIRVYCLYIYAWVKSRVNKSSAQILSRTKAYSLSFTDQPTRMTDPFSSEWGKFVCDTNTCEIFQNNLVRLLNDHFHNPQMFHSVVKLFFQNCTLMHPELDFQTAFINFRIHSLQVAQQITEIVNDVDRVLITQVKEIVNEADRAQVKQGEKPRRKKKKPNKRERRRKREIFLQQKESYFE